MNQRLIERVRNVYTTKFEKPDLIVRSPGRINLIGEHTDYNLGFVLPAAVNQAIYFAISPSGSDDCTLMALDQNETHTFRVSDLRRAGAGHWANYILGVVAEIHKAGKKVEGFNLVFAGDIPQGAGMSSSAALECGTCFALNELFNLGFERVEMIKMSQQAEHNYAGVKCGIMDQFASMMGREDKALMLDCRSLQYEYFPLQPDRYSLVLLNSNVHHNLASSEYNVRRAQCEKGVSFLRQFYPDIRSLRDVNIDQLNQHQRALDPVVYKRCRYVIEENRRVLEFAEALSGGQSEEAGAMLKEAQQAMQFEYEITCTEIDFMADFANLHEDILGARMMGGGFGGCTINLVEKGREESFITELSEEYHAKFDKELTPIQVRIDNGTSVI